MNLKAEEGRSKNELMHLIVLDYYNFFFVRIFFTLLSFPYVSVPLRGFRHERPHIFEAYTVKLLIGSISIGHLHSQ